VSRRWWTAGSVVAFAGTVLLWSWLLRQELSAPVTVLLVAGPLVLVFPSVLAGRRILDADPTPEHAAKVTTVVHAWLLLLFGVAIVTAVRTAGTWRGLTVPFPRPVAAGLVWATSAAAFVTVLNLALRGLGAPFAIALSRRLATDWLYSRTRNPMVLASLACVFAVGLWLQSALFLLWHLALLTPARLFFVKAYEERELEIRFGEPYRRYRAATPFLWPSIRAPGHDPSHADAAEGSTAR
jgi:protein-S-isoprenylcysteine O-methyltransferase Ste14